MRPVDVWAAGLVASAVAGAVCSLGFLLLTDLGGDSLGEVLFSWAAFAVWYGLGTGIALGIVPAGVAANAWPQFVRSVGEERAVVRLTGLVATMVLAELVLATIGTAADPVAATPRVLAATAVCTVIAWVHLLAARRIASRRVRCAVGGGAT